MTKTASRRSRSPVEWSGRLVLAALVSWIGYLSILQTVAQVLPGARIEEAHALAPGNGRVAGRLSQALYRVDASEADRARAVSLARDALQHDATAVQAVSTLAADAFLRGAEAEGERLLAYSHQLTRRDLRTQLMAIEIAVARDDIPGALKHYDIALRTQRNGAELLFPVLTSALSNPAIRTELIATLRGEPAWGNRFIDHAARSDADPAASAAFFRALQAARVPVPDAAGVALISRLLAAELSDAAWAYYETMRPGSDRRRSRDPAFKALLEQRSAFDWVAVNSPGITTALLPDPTGGLFDFTVSMGNGGTLLQQLQVLPAGDYTVEGHSIGIEQPVVSRPYWALRCQGGGEIARVEVPNSSRAGGEFRGRANVPAGCPVQVLALVARSSADTDGVSGQIDRILIRPSHPIDRSRKAP